LGEAKEVFDLCQTNQIDNIWKESMKAGNIPNSVVAQNVVETLMNLTYIISPLLLHKVPSLLHFLPTRAT
jgi:hypothetical protein